MEKGKYTPHIYFSDGSIFVAIGVFRKRASGYWYCTAKIWKLTKSR